MSIKGFSTLIPYTLLIISCFSLWTQAVLAEKKVFGIQVAAFRHTHRAEKAVKALKEKGHAAFFRHEEIKDKGKWYRVYIARFASREMASDKARQLKQNGIIPDYYIRPIADIPIGERKGDPRDRKIKGAEKAQKAVDQSSQPVARKPDRVFDGPDGPLVIRDITLHSREDLKETVLISVDRFFEPSVFALEKDKLRFVVDIKNVASVKKGLSKIPIKGTLIKRIRTHHHRGTHTFRVVLDLYPARNYDITQTFYNKENIYAIVVGEERPGDITIGPPKEEKDPLLAVHPSTDAKKKHAPRFRVKGTGLSHKKIKKMLIENHFYASCWNKNRDFCNPEGEFHNLFVDNRDGTVTDQSTGLMWQKGGTQDEMTWLEAGAYVQSMNRERLSGYTDWRLPTAEELASLMENAWKNGDLYIDPIFEKSQRYCWSSDTNGREKAWKANFNLGYFMDFPINTKNWVRMVRSVH